MQRLPFDLLPTFLPSYLPTFLPSFPCTWHRRAAPRGVLKVKKDANIAPRVVQSVAFSCLLAARLTSLGRSPQRALSLSLSPFPSVALCRLLVFQAHVKHANRSSSEAGWHLQLAQLALWILQYFRGLRCTSYFQIPCNLLVGPMYELTDMGCSTHASSTGTPRLHASGDSPGLLI